MPCSPRSNNLNPPDFGPPPVIPGFGIPFAPLQVPFPDVKIPDGIPEDLLALLDQLRINWPGGLSVPNPDELMKTIWDGVAALLNQLSPFLSLYNFFMALLEMIVCIIEVLCALFNPWATYKAIRKLYRTCLPNFLNLFPWMALIAMIIALLLLLLALLEYLYNMLLAFIKDLLANLEALGKAVQLKDTESQLEIARKISYILCLIEQLFAILAAFQAILAIIQALMEIGGSGLCSRGSGSGCCGEQYCPDFISNSPNGISDKSGRLMYYKTLYQNVPGFTGTLPNARTQAWQFVNDNTSATYQIKNIITPVGPDNDIFWPTPLAFDADSQLKKVPYLLSMRVFVNPADYGLVDPIGTPRFFRINSIIVSKMPYIGMVDYAGNTIGPNTGTFNLTGGLVFEDDGTTPFMISGKQASLTNFIFQTAQITPSVPVDDSVTYTDIEFTWTINYEALVYYSLITMMCIPGLANDNAVLNASVDFTPIATKLVLPDVNTATQCLTNALSELRKNVSIDNVAAFQSTVTGCIQTLQNQTKSAYVAAVIGGANDYQNSVTLTPDVQFVDSSITVAVQINDANGINLAAKAVGVESQIAEKIVGSVTLGTLSAFTYDGYGTFNAFIDSKLSGPGELKLEFNNQTFKSIINRDNIAADTAIQERIFSYEFVGISSDDTKVRRTDSDVANSEG